MNSLNTRCGLVVLLVAGMCSGPAVFASPLVYTPVNPSFGGNPLNGSILLNEAQAQNHTSAPTNSLTTADRLNAFNQALENAVLNRVSSSVIQKIVSATGQLLPGTIETTDFTVTVKDLGNGLVSVTTVDKATGQTTTFEISSAPP